MIKKALFEIGKAAGFVAAFMAGEKIVREVKYQYKRKSETRTFAERMYDAFKQELENRGWSDKYHVEKPVIEDDFVVIRINPNKAV